MKRIIPLIVLLSMLLGGCGFWDSTYVRITPSSRRMAGDPEENAPAGSYEELQAALHSLITSGVESGVINTVGMDAAEVEESLRFAAETMQNEDEIAAYAVRNVSFEVGTVGGKTAAAVSISYRRGALEIRKILHVEDMVQAEKAVYEALEDFNPRVVMQIDHYGEMDVQQLVRAYADTAPQIVMETPQVAQEVFGRGEARVVELSFSYANSREALRQMREQVQPVFDAAELYVSGDGADVQKYMQLQGFLMERFTYTLETSITPSYSLLRHGVGDSKAFATAYAAMCRRSGLECLVVTGTRMGTPWNWNIIRDDGRYYHVDLLRSLPDPAFEEMLDSDMIGYVWDYSAYPPCGTAKTDEPENLKKGY